MTERPIWDGGPGEHVDEGTIHAWLDGALDAASAERVAAHVASCEACSALAAEARGLIAGASRVVSALDEVPAGTRPGWAQAPVEGAAQPGPMKSAGDDQSLWRRLRVTPARAAIAATILVALGVTLTHDRVAIESLAPEATISARQREATVGGSSPTVAMAPPAPAQPKDRLLDSAVARNLEIAQGTRRMEAIREPTVPSAPAPRPTEMDAPAAMAEQRVAEGRAAAKAQQDTAGAAADRLRVRSEVAGQLAARPPDAANATPARPEMRKPAPEAVAGAAGMALPYADPGARSCFRLESPQAGAALGDQPLPLVVVVDSGPPVGTRTATVSSGTSGTAQRGTWTRIAKDSVTLTVQLGGLTGVIALGPGAGGRAGTATTGVIQERAASERADAASDVRARSARPGAAPPSAPAAGSASRVAPLRVTLRPVACSAR
jgi:hypothetical protein